MHLKIVIQPAQKINFTELTNLFRRFFAEHEPMAQVWLFPGESDEIRCDVFTPDYGERGRTVWMTKLMALLGSSNMNPQWFTSLSIYDTEQSDILIGELKTSNSLSDFLTSFS